MIVSNEPGYYAAGEFGIRIENLVVVEERAIRGAERPMLGFETISFAPIDLRLVEAKLMDRDEIAWLDALSRERARGDRAAGRRGDAGVAERGDAAGGMRHGRAHRTRAGKAQLFAHAALN